MYNKYRVKIILRAQEEARQEIEALRVAEEEQMLENKRVAELPAEWDRKFPKSRRECDGRFCASIKNLLTRRKEKCYESFLHDFAIC